MPAMVDVRFDGGAVAFYALDVPTSVSCEYPNEFSCGDFKIAISDSPCS